ncbi:MAG: hypothetical protein QNJ31_01695 [Candidatus Caenarcaniphilales bacterium]|nr:hypothetical protein [Candidatus Caenarcaniphilales bacterium]
MKINIYKETQEFIKNSEDKTNTLRTRRLANSTKELAESFLFTTHYNKKKIDEGYKKQTEFQEKSADLSLENSLEDKSNQSPQVKDFTAISINEINDLNTVETATTPKTKAVNLAIQAEKKLDKKMGTNEILLIILFLLNICSLFAIFKLTEKLNSHTSMISTISENIETLDSEVFFLSETIKDGLIDKSSFMGELLQSINKQSDFSTKSRKSKKYLLIKQPKKTTNNSEIRKKPYKSPNSQNSIKNLSNKSFYR